MSAANFYERLKEMQLDLTIMAHELNKSHFWDSAMRVQQTLLAIDHIFGGDDVDLDDSVDFAWPAQSLPPELER